MLFVLSRTFFFYQPGILERIHAFISYPALVLARLVAVQGKTLFSAQQSYEQLEQQYKRLQDEYQDLLCRHTQLQATMAFDESSKEIRDFATRYHLDHALLGRIIKGPVVEGSQTILVGRGLHHGVKRDMVASYKLQVVGRVTDVFDWYCSVLLITDVTSKVAAFANQTDAQGIVGGTNQVDRCCMKYVSHLYDIKLGDFVFSSGQGMVFPEGFCLGRVVKHELPEKSLHHVIQLEPLVDFTSLNFCLLTDQSSLNFYGVNHPKNS